MYVCSRLGVGEVRHSSPMLATCGRREQMRLVTAVFATAAIVALPVGVWAQEVFPDVEYIQGRTGFPETIKDVTNSLQTDPGSVGRKLMLGMFASKREEFLYLNTETSERAEAIVFKCHKKNSSPDMMAKIKFQIARLKPVATDTTGH